LLGHVAAEAAVHAGNEPGAPRHAASIRRSLARLAPEVRCPLTPEKTMKVMAIGTLKPLSQEQRQRYLPKEVPATLQLYLDGKMEQFWLRNKEEGVIFLLNVDSVDEADRLLKALPLGQAGLLTFELMPIGPLLPLGLLMKAK
jgi:muconolactone delta-isomerase